MITLVGIGRPIVTTFKPEEKQEQAAERILEELHRWAKALLPLRNNYISCPSGYC
jgi:hypothetical protein